LSLASSLSFEFKADCSDMMSAEHAWMDREREEANT